MIQAADDMAADYQRLVEENAELRTRVEELEAVAGQMTKIYAPLNEHGLPRWHEFYDDRYEGEKAAHAEGGPLGEAWVTEWKAVQ